MPAEAATRLKAAIGGPVRLEYLERAGHWCQEDRPDHIADRIHDFITEWEGVSP
jgi:pimeloyl-ACP methyl ester carboxylesterase